MSSLSAASAVGVALVCMERVRFAKACEISVIVAGTAVRPEFDVTDATVGAAVVDWISTIAALLPLKPQLRGDRFDVLRR
ncbi:MAG: hypothetical protein B7Z74_06035, partial [Deltaproteobacteria bacterium 21-66-5]